MNQRLISEIGRTQRLDIINSLKRTKGMSVNELVEKMGMSYMGIKQHCITLHRDGYLDTWRRPQKWADRKWSIALRAARTIFFMPIATSSRWTY
jgi:predicted ArsR family transcriptional regulator